MSAVPNEKNEPNKVEDFLLKYRDQHKVLLRRAREASETTNTPGWTGNYKAQRQIHERSESSAIACIVRDVDTIKLSGTNEDVEKSIKDSVKSLGEERIRFRAWESRAVENYRRSATDLANFIESIMRDAREREQNQPLLDRGFADEVREVVSKWESATFDEELGAVVMS